MKRAKTTAQILIKWFVILKVHQTSFSNPFLLKKGTLVLDLAVKLLYDT